MKKLFAVLGVATLCAAGMPTSAQAAGSGDKSDQALFDGTDPTSGETGVACGARKGNSKNKVAFTYFVAVSNWGSETRVLRIQYQDGSMARHQIPGGTSFSLSHSAGGTKDVDMVIKVYAEGPNPSNLAGGISILAPPSARPHPDLGGENLCVTLTDVAP